MAALKFSMLIVLFLPACAMAGSPKIQVNNHLDRCIKITNVNLENRATLPVVEFHAEILSSSAECGCKSALSQFSVTKQLNETKREILSAKVVIDQSGNKTWPLAAEASLIDNAQLALVLSCALPE